MNFGVNTSNAITILLFVCQSIILYKLFIKTESCKKEKYTNNLAYMILISLTIAFSFILSEIGLIRFFYPTLFDTKGIYDRFGAYLTIIIFYPIAEELITRGIILNHLCKKYKFSISNFIQALVFGILHFNINMVLFYLAFAFILGIVKKNMNIYYTILIHVLYNLTIFMFSTQNIKLPNISELYFLIIGIVFFAITFYITLNIKRFLAKKASSIIKM